MILISVSSFFSFMLHQQKNHSAMTQVLLILCNMEQGAGKVSPDQSQRNFSHSFLHSQNSVAGSIHQYRSETTSHFQRSLSRVTDDENKFDFTISPQFRKVIYDAGENQRCAHDYLSRWWASRNWVAMISSGWSVECAPPSSSQSFPLQAATCEMHLMKEKQNHKTQRIKKWDSSTVPAWPGYSYLL